MSATANNTPNTRVWAVANLKGGVGKTTSVITLGGLLAQQQQPTLLVDLDPQGSMTGYFGFNPEQNDRSIYALFDSQQDAPVRQLVHATNFPSLHLLRASTALSSLDRKMAGKQGLGLVLMRALSQLSGDYRYILIDCAPVIGVLMVNALAACDHLLIPVQTELLAVKGLERMLMSIDMINKARAKPLRYTIFSTLFDRRTRACTNTLEMIRAKFPEHLCPAVIPTDTQFRDACFAAKPLSWINDKSRGVQAYAQLLQFVNSSRSAEETALSP